ncbi:MAG: proline--tRNA ligase [Natronomonas sp.]
MTDDQELGVTESKAHNIGEWYAEVVQKSGMIDYSGMSGFMILNPWGHSVWEEIRNAVDGWFQETGVENAYYPLFIPESQFEQEKNIVEGFDPEVAWVTHGGRRELEERLAVRPTSESVITPHLGTKIRSYRDLPKRVNQWCSVVRWEATETKPFLRTREFLWQEGHGAFATEADAWEDTMLRLQQYVDLYEDVLALPALTGRKPEHDKFPGAEVTTTVETLMPDGKSIQGATPHYLGTTFAEEYGITFTDENETEQTAHTTSWGSTWRTIGAVIMAHGDDQGLVLPPTVAPKQVVIVPIWTEDNREAVLEYAESLYDDLEDDFRVRLDDRDHRNPGFKFNEWELKGVPLRIEVGSNELEEGTATLVHRPDGEDALEERDEIAETVDEHLDSIYGKLYDAASEYMDERITEADSREEILGTIGRQGGYVKAGWCGDEACEEPIKDAISAEIVMVDLDADAEPIQDTCAICGDAATETAYFAKSH